MNLSELKTIVLVVVTALALNACDTGGANGPEPVVAEMAEDIPGNVNTLSATRAPVENVQGDTETDPGYTFYDLNTGEIVEDTTSSSWDIGFGSTTIIANSAHDGGIQVKNTAYAKLQQAPGDGYAAETERSSWYNYDFRTHTVTPKEDHSIVVHTTDGQYAKIEILSYYQDSDTEKESRYFTFNYTLQTEEGNTRLYHEDTETYFDLDTGEIVEDSASSQWDIAFSGTAISANAENDGGIMALNIPFADVTEAPTEGYEESNTSWYTYTGNTPPVHAVLPVDGLTLVVQTPEGKYAKVRMISYYKGNPDTSTQEFADTNTRPESRYFTFEYAVQTAGSVNFE
ncbi:HmuY family protein [Gracilimonas sp.]|uniref:HmuY family protein n=1 Tax=Gracilimonas sp. TaxID=1974203 RepID=UPI003D0987ED